MQCPHCHSDPNKAECFYGDKGYLGSQPYVAASSQDCGSLGLGGGWRNAVWSFVDGAGADAAPSPAPASDNQWLIEHNARRQKYHTRFGRSYVPLKWSVDLARSSQNYANKLIRIPGCEIQHGYQGDSYGGENLASRFSSSSDLLSHSADDVLTAWAEREENLPGMEAGHYTQVVWRATRYVGCAQARKSGCTISVCRYMKPGNCNGGSNCRDCKRLMLEDDSPCGPSCPAEGCF
eukprot:jgi/Tetstr1/460284/TSEL_005584.t1